MIFDRFAELMARRVVRGWFFAILLAGVLAWLPTLFLWDSGASDLFIDALANPLSLLLLVLIENSQFRSEEAQDRRQDAIEGALALVLEQLGMAEDDESRRDELRAAAGGLREQAAESSRMAAAELDSGDGSAPHDPGATAR